MPEVEAGVSYAQVAAGDYHTVLLRSDGRAVACGSNRDGECDLPEMEPGVSYCPALAVRDVLIQLLVEGSRSVVCRSLGGRRMCWGRFGHVGLSNL